MTDVAALHAEPPDINDEEALMDALRVVLHEQPDIHERDALRVLGLPEATARVTYKALRRLREQEDYESLRVWEELTVAEKEAAYMLVSSWLRTTLVEPPAEPEPPPTLVDGAAVALRESLGLAPADAPEDEPVVVAAAPVVAAAVAEKDAQAKNNKWTVTGAAGGLALGVAVLGAGHIGAVAGAVAAGAAAYARTKPKPQAPPFPSLLESGAGVHEPMVRLLHLAPTLQTVAPGPAWAALLSEAEPDLISKFTDEWYRSCCGADFSRLQSVPRYDYAGVDGPPELRVWLAAARSAISDGTSSGDEVDLIKPGGAVSALPGLEELRLVARDPGSVFLNGAGAPPHWSLLRWDQSGTGGSCSTLVVVFRAQATALFLRGAGLGETLALPGCRGLHAHKGTLEGLLQSGSLGRLRTALGPFRKLGHGLRLVGHGAGGATALLALMQLMVPPRTDFEVDDEPPWTEAVSGGDTGEELQLPGDLDPSADFSSMRAVGFGSPAVLALPPVASPQPAGSTSGPLGGAVLPLVVQPISALAAKLSTIGDLKQADRAPDGVGSDTQPNGALPTPGRPEIYENVSGSMLRVRWRLRASEDLKTIAADMDPTAVPPEFELQYGYSGPLGYHLRFGGSWKSVAAIVTSCDGEGRYAQAVGGVAVRDRLLFRVRVRAGFSGGEEEEEEAASGGSWSDWSVVSEVTVVADPKQLEMSYLQGKIAEAEQQIQRLFDSEAQRQERLERFQPEPDPEPEPVPMTPREPQLEPAPEPELMAPRTPGEPEPAPELLLEKVTGGSLEEGDFILDPASPLQRTTSGFMKDLRLCAATHYDLIINRGDLVPRILGGGGGRTAAGAAAAGGAQSGPAVVAQESEDETGELRLTLRHVLRTRAATHDSPQQTTPQTYPVTGSEECPGAAVGSPDPDELRSVDISDVRKALDRYAHHGSVHILHAAPESATTHIATVAVPSSGFDESWLWLRRGGGGVFVTQGLADHSVERYAASLARLCAASKTSGRPRPPPPPTGDSGSASAGVGGGRRKVYVPKISDDQRL